MGGVGVAGILLTLVIWFFVLFVFIYIIRYALDSSKTARQVSELANDVAKLRQELKDRDERDRKEKAAAAAGGRVIDMEA